jgi:predicted transcriptional regulator of viral defense system
MKNDDLKIYGPRTGQLVTELKKRGRLVFTLKDVHTITGLAPGSARSLMHKAERRGQIRRLKSGTYCLTTAGNHPYVIAAELFRDEPYFLSHDTAFDYHQLSGRPPCHIRVSTIQRMRSQTIAGYQFRFVTVPADKFFGAESYRASKQHQVMVSDVERTILDGLRQPEYVGGIAVVAQALRYAGKQMLVARLIHFAERLQNDAVLSRLGHILQLFGLLPIHRIYDLWRKTHYSNHLLDPTLPPGGVRDPFWGLRCNVNLNPAPWSASITGQPCRTVGGRD